MKPLITSLLFILFPCIATAQTQRDSVAVYGNVAASFTHEKLKGVHVEIMRPDSSLITEFHTDPVYGYGGYPHNIDAIGYLYIPRSSCIFRFSKEGYLTQCVNLDKKQIKRREKRLFLGEILMKKKPKPREKQLGEAVVTASKIRMVVKGDTLIYNADAFQLAEGSMLDGLIKRLPGFELRNGQIRVNGQYVNSLLVNGEDFFRGDPRVALENLPAYMVDKVKVYRKEHDWSYITKERSKEELPLVVDVNLKRQYAVGWVANASAGYGLENRYLARLFALRFTDNSRLAVYGNANNTNDTREPGISGDWNAQNAPSGRTEMQAGGFEALVKDKKGTWKYTGNAKAFHQETNDRSVTSTETFQPGLGSSTFARMRRQNTGRNFSVQTAHQYNYKKQQDYVSISGETAYQRTRNRGDMWGAEFTDDPKDAYRAASLDSIFLYSSDRLMSLLVNSQRNKMKEKAETWNGNIRLNSFFAIPHTPDYAKFSATASIEKRENTSFSDYSLHYGQSADSKAADDKRQRYATAPALAVNANINASYTYRPDWAYITPYYQLAESYRDADRRFYRLDRLGSDAPAFGELPSTTAALAHCIDAQNTYTSQLNTLTHKAGIDWSIWLPGKLPSHSIILKPAVEWQTDRLTYHRDLLRAKTRRNKVTFNPAVSWGFDNCRISYKLNHSHPDPISLLDYTDNADPLNLYKGNPGLKQSTEHTADFSRSFFNSEKGWHFFLKGEWAVTRNAIAHGMTYDQTTGVRTYSPRNVDGNWNARLSADYKQPLDKKQRHILASVTDINYHNSVDYVTERSSVRNLTVSEALRLNTRIRKCLFDLSVSMKYLHAESARANFDEINSFDLKYGVAAQVPLPANIALSADFTLYHRTGYSDASMNDCLLVANARLGKTFLNGRLGLTLDAFDIFHGLSNVTKVLNAQGLVETWHNSLPSYVMLQVAYKFSKQPKKKQ